MPAAKSYRIKVPAREGAKSLAKSLTEEGLLDVYPRIRARYANETIRIVAPDGARRNIKPGSSWDVKLKG